MKRPSKEKLLDNPLQKTPFTEKVILHRLGNLLSVRLLVRFSCSPVVIIRQHREQVPDHTCFGFFSPFWVSLSFCILRYEEKKEHPTQVGEKKLFQI
jgi:hypothetical protein